MKPVEIELSPDSIKAFEIAGNKKADRLTQVLGAHSKLLSLFKSVCASMHAAKWRRVTYIYLQAKFFFKNFEVARRMFLWSLKLWTWKLREKGEVVGWAIRQWEKDRETGVHSTCLCEGFSDLE